MAAAEKPWLQALLASKKTCVVQDGQYETSDNRHEVLLSSDNSKFSIAVIGGDPCTYVRKYVGAMYSLWSLVLLFLNVLGRRKVHYVLPDGREMVEEYDMQNGKLLGMRSVCNRASHHAVQTRLQSHLAC